MFGSASVVLLSFVQLKENAVKTATAVTSTRGWFQFTNRDYVMMGMLIAATGAFQALWANVLGANLLGPFNVLFASYGFNIAAFVVLYFVPVPGAATVVKFLGAFVELLLGNPFGPIAIFYGTAEGIAVDLAFVYFGRRLSLNMMILGSVLAWLIAAPVDAYRDAVLINLEALLAYFGPGLIGKIWISLLCWWTIVAMYRAGLPTTAVIANKEEPEIPPS